MQFLVRYSSAFFSFSKFSIKKAKQSKKNNEKEQKYPSIKSKSLWTLIHDRAHSIAFMYICFIVVAFNSCKLLCLRLQQEILFISVNVCTVCMYVVKKTKKAIFLIHFWMYVLCLAQTKTFQQMMKNKFWMGKKQKPMLGISLGVTRPKYIYCLKWSVSCVFFSYSHTFVF